MPICICKSLRVLFVCLFEPGQVCWIPANPGNKTSNPISYYPYMPVVIICFELVVLASFSFSLRLNRRWRWAGFVAPGLVKLLARFCLNLNTPEISATIMKRTPFSLLPLVQLHFELNLSLFPLQTRAEADGPRRGARGGHSGRGGPGPGPASSGSFYSTEVSRTLSPWKHPGSRPQVLLWVVDLREVRPVSLHPGPDSSH